MLIAIIPMSLCRKQWSIYWRVHLSFPECDVVYEEERCVRLSVCMCGICMYVCVYVTSVFVCSVPESTTLSALYVVYQKVPSYLPCM